ncbi:MAG: calcium/sodium antiporter [Candidatus Methanospirareceae archaeon]
MVLISILGFVLGLVLLVKGSDYLVKAAVSIAAKLGVSEFVIGLTLVAVGTSLPELASSIFAALKAESDIVVGNVIGSNIANIGLIVGIGALLATITTHREMLQRDGYIMLLAALLFLLFSFNGVISRFEALFLVLLYVAYAVFLFENTSTFTDEETRAFREFLRYFLKFTYLITIKNAMAPILNHKERNRERPGGKLTELSRSGLLKDFTVLGLSGIAVVVGARFLVTEAVFFAEFFDISKTVIGISIVAVGTSLPELGVTASAARQGYGNIAVGNVLGSNIANIFLVAGASALVFPITVVRASIIYNVPFMIFISVVLLIFIKTDWKITRREGITFLLLYAFFLISSFSITPA